MEYKKDKKKLPLVFQKKVGEAAVANKTWSRKTCRCLECKKMEMDKMKQSNWL